MHQEHPWLPKVTAEKDGSLTMRVCSNHEKIILVAVPLVLVTWLFVGLDRYVGDHEVGSGWDPFIKHKPTTTMFYKNPAQFGLDMEPFKSLDEDDKKNLIEYCRVRYGTDDIKRCYELFLAGRV
ncbi:hypothetical protein [Collimonas silvisoli]|uniref:hypothetical protein n=1 Tax=Collimonas silvisoli TaxID=2825884 RepID=UPI001B8B9498|nr:hypothetical protein [Collimonas silvisoli]